MVQGSDDRSHAPACVLYGSIEHATDSSRSWRPAEELLTGRPDVSSPAVLVADASLLRRIGSTPALSDDVVIVAADDAAERALGARADFSLALVADDAVRAVLLQAACRLATARFETRRAQEEFQDLSRIGMGLMCERDRTTLLREILAQGKRLTCSDAGALLLLEQDEGGRARLRPVLYAFDSLKHEVVTRSSVVPVNEESVIGHVALSKEPLVVADAYQLPYDSGFELNVDFDIRHGYRRRSMLVMPMMDQLERVLGLLVLINRKTDQAAVITSREAADRYVIEYSAHEVRVARLLASQAAVAIENARLQAQLEGAFESFVAASVSAIDLRDPATAGHSMRVATLVGELAHAVERAESGPYRDVHFTKGQLRELRFAALLHDFGKVTVCEDVLLKAKKLPPVLQERVEARFDLIRSGIELAWCAAHEVEGAPGDAVKHVAELEELERCHRLVREANEPNVLATPTAVELPAIARMTFERPDGAVASYLTQDELHFLELPKGTLDDGERAEAESHVTNTYRFLSQIPWTEDLKNLAEYAYGHHEALNGSGYPRGLTGKDIPLQTRMITVADTFDALTSCDRPYKAAVSRERALEILEAEAEAGRMDAELVRVMTELEANAERA